MPNKDVAFNRKAFHDYHILERMEAGIVLTGTEIKAIRNGNVNLREGYARVENGELWLFNAHIARYEHGNRYNHEPTRTRKLLVHRRQLRELQRQVQDKGVTLVPLGLYLKDDIAKIDLGVVRGKKLYDKRQDTAKREAEREMGRAIRRTELAVPK